MSLFNNKRDLFYDPTLNRIGLLYVEYYSDKFYIRSSTSEHNMLLEVKEIFCDVKLSKIEIIRIAWHSDGLKYNLKRLNPWIDSSKIYWLKNPIDISRNKKIDEII